MVSNRHIISTVLIHLLTILASCQLSDTKSSQQCGKEDFRLPGNIRPIYNTVEIYTSLLENDFRFWGYSEIKINVTEETDKIILHSKDLNIREDEITVTTNYGYDEELHYPQSLTVGTIDYNEDYDFLIINVDDTLAANAIYIVHIPFNATLNDSLYGYVRTSYVDSSHNTIWYSATNFNNGEARSAFPHFDEPGMATVFSISLAHSNAYKAISNMYIARTTAIIGMDDWIKDTFFDTPQMSSYLLAMMICQFESYNIPDENLDTEVNIWGRKEIMDQLTVVKEMVPPIFSYFEKRFAMVYPPWKLDIIAAPSYNDQQSSYGACMINESRLIYNEDSDSVKTPFNIAFYLSISIAHAWIFGLVSINWWSELPINKGLAYIYTEEAISVATGLSEYQNIDICAYYYTDMADDSAADSNLVLIAPIEDPKHLMKNISATLFYKSFLFLRMLYMVVGPDAFLTGVINYLNDYQFQVVTVHDFLEEINEAGQDAKTITTDIDLNVIMENNLYTEGYALVNVNIDYQNQVAFISQKRFVSDTRLSDEARSELEREFYSIPLSWVISNNLNFDNFMVQDWLYSNDILEISLKDFTQDDFILFDVQMYGPYRVTYSLDNWHNIGKYLLDQNQFSNIHPLNRAQLMSDSLEIASAGIIPYDVPFKLLPYLAFETMKEPLDAAFYSLINIHRRLAQSNLRESYNAFVGQVLQPLYEKYDNITFIPDNIIEADVKLLVDHLSLTYGLKRCLDQGHDVLMQWYNIPDPDSNNIPMSVVHIDHLKAKRIHAFIFHQVFFRKPRFNVTVRSNVYRSGIQLADASLWNWMYERFVGANHYDEKTRILSALGYVQDSSILSNYLQMSLDANQIAPTWFSTVFGSVLDSDQAISFPVAFDFLRNNFQSIIKILNNDVTQACPLLIKLGYFMQTKNELDQFKAFLDSAEIGQSCQDEIDKAIKMVNNNISWHSIHDAEVGQLLQGYV